jgi:hypothetical protein
MYTFWVIESAKISAAFVLTTIISNAKNIPDASGQKQLYPPGKRSFSRGNDVSRSGKAERMHGQAISPLDSIPNWYVCSLVSKKFRNMDLNDQNSLHPVFLPNIQYADRLLFYTIPCEKLLFNAHVGVCTRARNNAFFLVFRPTSKWCSNGLLDVLVQNLKRSTSISKHFRKRRLLVCANANRSRLFWVHKLKRPSRTTNRLWDISTWRRFF